MSWASPLARAVRTAQVTPCQRSTSAWPQALRTASRAWQPSSSPPALEDLPARTAVRLRPSRLPPRPPPESRRLRVALPWPVWQRSSLIPEKLRRPVWPPQSGPERERMYHWSPRAVAAPDRRTRRPRPRPSCPTRWRRSFWRPVPRARVAGRRAESRMKRPPPVPPGPAPLRAPAERHRQPRRRRAESGPPGRAGRPPRPRCGCSGRRSNSDRPRTAPLRVRATPTCPDRTGRGRSDRRGRFGRSAGRGPPCGQPSHRGKQRVLPRQAERYSKPQDASSERA